MSATTNTTDSYADNDTVRKIIALIETSEHAGTTEEATTFAAHATRLILKHNLDRKRIEAARQNRKEHGEYVNKEVLLSVKDGPYVAAHRALLHTLAAGNFCTTCYVPHSNRVYVVGEKVTVDIVWALYVRIALELSNLAAESWAKGYDSLAAFYDYRVPPSKSVEWRRSFLLGANTAITRRLQEERRQAEAEAEARRQPKGLSLTNPDADADLEEIEPEENEVRALIVSAGAELKAAMGKFHPKLGKSGKMSKATSTQAWSDGRVAGTALALHDHKVIE